MRHLITGRRLNRKPAHLLALKRNLACSLFAHERIITTVAKAKELRPFAEKLITLAKKGAAALEAAKGTGEDATKARLSALAVRRKLMQTLGGKRVVVVTSDKESSGVDIVNKLLNDIGPRFSVRPGGYTRIIKRTERRLGDAGVTAFIELLAASEKVAAAPAPKVS